MRKVFKCFWLFLAAACTQNQNEFYSLEDYDNVEKIDVHVHIRAERDDFVKQAHRDNFKALTIVVDGANKFDNVQNQFYFSKLQKEHHPDTVAFATAFSMEGWDRPGWLDKTMTWLDSGIRAGAVAVKVWKNIGMVYRDTANNLVMIDDQKFDPVFKMLADRKITLIGHLGEPKNCWLPLEEMTTNNDKGYFREHPQYYMYNQPDMPSYEDQVAARDRMLEKNPDLTFVGAHLGSLEWSVDELAKRLDKFPNMAVDMAARMGQLFYQTGQDRERVRQFFIRYQDRLLYATDTGDSGEGSPESLARNLHETWYRDWRYFVTDEAMTSDLVDAGFRGLKLPRSVVDKIYHENAKKWFHTFQDGI